MNSFTVTVAMKQCLALEALGDQVLSLYTDFLTRIVANHALLPSPRNIPTPDAIRGINNSLCVIGTRENALCFRKNRYAVRVLSKDHVSLKLKQALIPVFIVDATLEQQSDVELFNRIRDVFTMQRCCVVVVDTDARKGAPVSDVFFKWCAEFTRCNPRAHVICTSPDVTWLATENQNR